MSLRAGQVSRRGFCLGALSSIAFSARAQGMTILEQLVPSIDPYLEMKNAHTNEVVKTRFYYPDGYDLDAVHGLNHLLRDWRQKETRQIDVKVYWALAAIRMAAMKDGHDGNMILLSGFRTQKTNNMLRERGVGAARNSLHLKAMAADITMPGLRMSDVAEYAKWLEVGGVGNYRSSHFVHIDSGRQRTWGF